MENNEQFDAELEELKALLEDKPAPEHMELPQPEPVEETQSDLIPEPQPEDFPESQSRNKPEKKKDNPEKTVLLYLHDLIYLLGALMIVSLLLVRIVVVSGSSMNNTLLNGDYLFVLSNTIYHDPQQGDIVVVSKESFDNGKPIVKRVIATEGQWVRIKDGLVYVGDDKNQMEAMEEDYTTSATLDALGTYEHAVQVPEGCIFCLGDNRSVSHDSRSSDIGMIDNNEVLGKVLFLFLPGSMENEDRDFGRIGVVQ